MFKSQDVDCLMWICADSKPVNRSLMLRMNGILAVFLRLLGYKVDSVLQLILSSDMMRDKQHVFLLLSCQTATCSVSQTLFFCYTFQILPLKWVIIPVALFKNHNIVMQLKCIFKHLNHYLPLWGLLTAVDNLFCCEGTQGKYPAYFTSVWIGPLTHMLKLSDKSLIYHDLNMSSTIHLHILHCMYVFFCQHLSCWAMWTLCEWVDGCWIAGGLHPLMFYYGFSVATE